MRMRGVGQTTAFGHVVPDNLEAKAAGNDVNGRGNF
jgi:hypothetical protein